MEQLMAFPLCDQTVTVYRQTDGGIWQQVISGCFYTWEDVLQEGDAPCLQRRFLLVVPGTDIHLQPGDRVLAGEGPQVELSDWKRFVPALVPGLSRVAWVRRYPTHTEAGNRKNL